MSNAANQSLARGLAVLDALAGGAGGLREVADATGLPVATVHRLVVTFEQCGFIARPERGVIVPGPALLRLAASLDRNAILAAMLRPIVRRLAAKTGEAAQLGILEGDMVTYLVKEGQASEALFTREGMQLEAYCSGLGKVLLAALPPVARQLYLANGPFVALTDRTVTDPAMLAVELERTGEAGFATDDGEVDAGLHCVAAPIRDRDGVVIAALSLSSRDAARRPVAARLAVLRAAIGKAEAALAHWNRAD